MTVEDRLNKLERENKSWRRIALGLALVFCVSLSCSQGTQAPTPSRAFAEGNETFDTIRARHLKIVSPSGEVVAALTGLDTGGMLQVNALAAETNMPSTQTLVTGGAVQLRAFNGVETGIANLGSLALLMTVTEMNGGAIDVYNPFGKLVVSMQSDKTNQGMVSVHDVNGGVSKALSAR